MTHKRHLVCGTIAILAVALPLQSASATCPNALASGAVWHLHIMEVSPSPEGANVIKCVMTFGSGGNFTAPCTNFNTGSTAAQSVNISGKITLTAACDFTGTITVPGDAKAFVKFGHINGNIGSGVGIQGTGANTQVLHLTFVKK